MLRPFTRLLARTATRGRPPAKTVAIVVPLSDRSDFTADERISLRHLRHHLSRYDTYFVAPRGSSVRVPGVRVKYFHPKFFGSAVAHNHLTYAPRFYRAFADYRYIFFYHLDALVFSDQLETWCETGLDYIGPPWLQCAQTPWIKRSRVGNGGFTLLKVASALAVLRARYERDPFAYWLDLFTRNHRRLEPVVAALRRLQRQFPNSRLLNRTLVEWEQMRRPAPHNRNNDIFWSDRAVRYMPSFKVASLEQGLRFAFEAEPRTCLKLAGGMMPFGCHAWTRYDRPFWEPFLLEAPARSRAFTANVAAA
jgi:hypothetical protein